MICVDGDWLTRFLVTWLAVYLILCLVTYIAIWLIFRRR